MRFLTVFLVALFGVNLAGYAADMSIFKVLATADVGKNPHGLRLRDGLLYVAMSGENEIWVLDAENLAVNAKWPVENVPLDLIASGDGWIVAPFSGDYLEAYSASGKPGKRWAVPKGPSLFSPYTVRDTAYITSEFGNGFTLFDTQRQVLLKTYKTGDRPYPGAVTRDGILAFIPNRDENTVTVIDLLNQKTLATTPVCSAPEGGALTHDQTHYMVTCSQDGKVAFINTASFAVVAEIEEGIGERPFSVVAGEDGRYAYVNNAGGDTISVVDTVIRKVIDSITVGKQPIVMRVYGNRMFVSNEVSNTVNVLRIPGPKKITSATTKNEVILLGLSHRVETNETTRQLIETIKPDYIITEIPPNRLEQTLKGFAMEGEVTEPRVMRFPEYKSVVFDLSKSMNFEVIAAAAWTEPMNNYRRAAFERLEKDPARVADMATYHAALDAMNKAVNAGGRDNVAFLNSEAYDALSKKGLGVYDRLLNEDLGPGGWTNINKAHYALVEKGLDAHRNEGKRFLIIFGAAHTTWFREHLHKRNDIKVLDVRDFLDR